MLLRSILLATTFNIKGLLNMTLKSLDELYTLLIVSKSFNCTTIDVNAS